MDAHTVRFTVWETVEQAIIVLLERATVHDTLADGPSAGFDHRAEAERLFGALVDIEIYHKARYREDVARLLRQEGILIKGW